MDDEFFGLLEPTVTGLGLELVDAEVRTGLVRVVVDREGGADVDAITDATRALSQLLDHNDPQPGHRYTLEVSSPGLERPLRSPRQFARAVGETVTLRTHCGSEGERRVRGKVVSADDDGFVLEVGDLEEGERRFSYDEVERARTVFDWPSQSSSPAKAPRGSSRLPEARRHSKRDAEKSGAK